MIFHGDFFLTQPGMGNLVKSPTLRGLVTPRAASSHEALELRPALGDGEIWETIATVGILTKISGKLT